MMFSSNFITDREYINIIVDFINTYHKKDINPENVEKIDEGSFDMGICDTCSYWVNGLYIHYKDNYKRDFFDVTLSTCLEWIALGKPLEETIVQKPENISKLKEILKEKIDDINAVIEWFNNNSFDSRRKDFIEKPLLTEQDIEEKIEELMIGTIIDSDFITCEIIFKINGEYESQSYENKEMLETILVDELKGE